jgi:asparagine synthase (glutamine-hydrolysing)
VCGIAGIVSSTQRELGPLLKEMLGSMQHRGPDGAGFVIGKICQRKPTLEQLQLDGKKGIVALGHVRLAITGGAAGLQPFQSENRHLSMLHNGEVYNYRDLSQQLDSPETLKTGSDSEVLMKLIEEAYSGDLVAAMKKVLRQLDGVYALAVTDQEQTVIARDRIGVRQLYFYVGREFVAFASEKKPLLALGGEGIEIHRLPPGQMMVLEHDNYQLRPFWEPDQLRSDGVIRSRYEALSRYDQAIKESVRKRVAGRDHVGIIFSGGVDSFLIAHLVKQLGVPLQCYTAGRTNGASDIDWARRIAEKFDLPLQVRSLDVDDIERLIPQLIHAIEAHSRNQVEVAVPMYASVRMAQEAGERVILTGQGADELFGGYPWYPTIVEREGYYNFVRHSWEDTFLLYKECLEREDKIAMAHSLELRVPYLDPEVIRVAFQIAPALKIHSGNDTQAKRIHREYAQSQGVPEHIAFRAKEAAQHGANVHDAFEEMAERHGLTAALVEEAGYDPDKTITEKLGSSSRYGYRYGRHDLWKPLPHVQFYLDSQAAELGLLPPGARYHWETVRQELETLEAGVTAGGK